MTLISLVIDIIGGDVRTNGLLLSSRGAARWGA
jgi:hypothetical protein